MIGAIAGDIIGSVYENRRSWLDRRIPDFEPLFANHARFTDDTVLTIAVADALMNGGDLVEVLKDYARAYPSAGYGGRFLNWVESDGCHPYNSWGNGSAMRVSPVAYVCNDLDEVRIRARWTAEVTHNHPEGIRGAQATAAAVFLALKGADKPTIRAHVESEYGYDLSPTIDEIRPDFRFDVSCQGTVPPALIAFLESDSCEHAIRLAVSLGGDADTLACIAGSVAGAFHGVPDSLRDEALRRLDDPLRDVTLRFEGRRGTASRTD